MQPHASYVCGVSDTPLLFLTIGATAAVLTITTAGQTVPFLRRVTWLAPRRPDIGPQGFPVNRTAAAAGTTELGDDPDWVLEVVGADGQAVSFDRPA